jgi:hypothetical protein
MVARSIAPPEVLAAFVARACPVHLPNLECPPESDKKAHNDYKAKVRSNGPAAGPLRAYSLPAATVTV